MLLFNINDIVKLKSGDYPELDIGVIGRIVFGSNRGSQINYYSVLFSCDMTLVTLIREYDLELLDVTDEPIIITDKAKCVCSSKDLLNFGCRCGGI